MNSIKIYAVLTGLLIIVLLANGILSGVAYLDNVELGLEDINAIISLISLISVFLCVSQLSAWLCCQEVTPFKLIAIGNLVVDVLVLIVFCYLNGSYITSFDEEQDTSLSAAIMTLSIFCIFVYLIRVFLMLYGLYKDLRNNKIQPEVEMNIFNEQEKAVVNFASEVAASRENLNDSIVSDSVKVPAKWTNPKRKKEYFLVDVDKDSDEYRGVIDDFVERMEPNSANITRLQRVENLAVYLRYKAYKDELCAEKINMRKKLLFYATRDEEFIDQICQYGFIDATTSVLHTEKNGVCFSYFPKLFDDRLTTTKTPVKKMFRVKVITESDGGVEEDTKIIDSTKNEHFTDYSQGSIYICRNEAQSYPEYLITYTS